MYHYAADIVLAMVTLWLGFVAFDISNGRQTVQQAMRDFFIAGMVIGALSDSAIHAVYLRLLPPSGPQHHRHGARWPNIAGCLARHGFGYCDLGG